MEVFMLPAVVVFLVSWVCFLCIAVLRLNEFIYTKKGLPPGTMGWPFFGETAAFLKQGPDFMKNQRARFGSFFKTHFLGCPTIISMDPELNRYILMNEAKGLVPGYPKAMVNILGKRNIAAVHGSTHKYLRNALLSLVSPTSIKDLVLPTIDPFVKSFLSNWAGQVIDIQRKTREMAFLSALKQVIKAESDSISDELMPEYFKIVLGTLSLPIDLPGTSYRRGLEGRKSVVAMVKKVMEGRRASKETHNDMLGCLLKEDVSRHPLSEEDIIDLVITLLYSGFETVSRTTMMAVKYLQDHPRALHAIRKEHLDIRAKKKADGPIDYEDFKSMRFTRAVIFETLRLATIVHGVLRITTKELELNGFVIPKGWRIYVYTRELHYDSDIYSDEIFTFNPWRWLEKNLEGHNYFLLFGRGSRLCPGKELGIAEISIFLHYFVTQYRWEEVGEQKLLKFPRVEAPNGFHFRVSKY